MTIIGIGIIGIGMIIGMEKLIGIGIGMNLAQINRYRYKYAV